MNERYYSFRRFLKERFPGERVVKIPLHAGFTCPNRDGTLSNRGCVFCDPHAAGPVGQEGWSIERQIEAFLLARTNRKFIAYFQSHCNTLGAPSELRGKYEIMFSYPEIVGLFVATRPDAIAPPVLELLAEMARRTFFCVELGLQSVHDASLERLNRNHTFAQFGKTFAALRAKEIPVVVHLIIGIPGESRQQMRETIAVMNSLLPFGVKLHLLHVLRGTELQAQYERGEISLLQQDAFMGIVIDLLARLDPRIVVHRIGADREKDWYVAPEWALHKAAFLQALHKRMESEGIWQGCHLQAHTAGA